MQNGLYPDERMVSAGWRDEVLTCSTEGCEHFGKDFIPTGFASLCSSCGEVLVPQDRDATAELDKVTYGACERVDCAWKGEARDESPEATSEAHLEASAHRRRTGHHTIVVHNLKPARQ